MNKGSSETVMHVISHTHWDREWYLPFQGFRMKLVDLIDNLLNILESDSEYKCFHMDGQTIILDDYLEIRPENEERMTKLIRDGRIIIGPWYVQPDEYLPSGEAHIRNLLAGKAMCDKLGVKPLPMGYVVDLFGHISQFPQILRGFGIEHAILFRGVYRDLVPNEFIWQSPNGSEVLTFHLHDDFAYSTFWYSMHCGTPHEMGAYFGKRRPPSAVPHFFTREEATERAQWLKEELASRSATRHLLFMDGIDHIEANPNIPHTISAINEGIGEGRVIHSSFRQYMEAVDSEIDRTALPRLTGELRWPNKDGNLNAVLVGTLSSRMRNKLDNDRCQRLMERWVEPFTAVASAINAYTYPRAFVERAWRWLLENHPHDSICGCSIDQVHKDMNYRFDQCELIAEELIKRALTAIAKSVDVGFLSGGEAAWIVFNSRSHAISGVLLATVTLDASLIAQSSQASEWNLFNLVGDCGDGGRTSEQKCAVQILGETPAVIHELCGHDVPSFRHGRTYRVAVDMSVPALGYKAFKLKKAERETTVESSGNLSLVTGPTSLANEYISVKVNPNGTVKVTDKATGEVFDSLCHFEDRGDVGDGWNWVVPVNDAEFTSTQCEAEVTVLLDGPLVARLKVAIAMPVPASASPDRQSRSESLAPLRIESEVTLKRGSRLVEIDTRVENVVRDHRLRVVFPTQVDVDSYVTDTQYDVIERNIRLPNTAGWREQYPTTAPCQNFVAVTSQARSLGVVVQGLRECSVYDREDRAIALTLFRGFQNAVGTTGEDGGQCLGTLIFRYGIRVGKGNWAELGLYAAAEELNLPVRVVVIDEHTHKGDLYQRTASFICLNQAAGASGPIQLSAVKVPEEGEGLVIRLFNPSNASASCTMAIPNLIKVREISLDETVEGPWLPLSDSGNSVDLELEPKTILSLRALLG